MPTRDRRGRERGIQDRRTRPRRDTSLWHQAAVLAVLGVGLYFFWSLIGAVKKEISLPVIGNGDIATGEDALQMMESTGCDAVMIGRAAIGNPFIFSDVIARLKGELPPRTDLALRQQTMREYLDASVTYIGEAHACYMMRSRLGWFVKGLPHNSRFRESIKRVTSQIEAETLIDAYFEYVEKNADDRSEA